MKTQDVTQVKGQLQDTEDAQAEMERRRIAAAPRPLPGPLAMAERIARLLEAILQVLQTQYRQGGPVFRSFSVSLAVGASYTLPQMEVEVEKFTVWSRPTAAGDFFAASLGVDVPGNAPEVGAGGVLIIPANGERRISVLSRATNPLTIFIVASSGVEFDVTI